MNSHKPLIDALSTETTPDGVANAKTSDVVIHEAKLQHLQSALPWKVNAAMVDLYEKSGGYDTRHEPPTKVGGMESQLTIVGTSPSRP